MTSVVRRGDVVLRARGPHSRRVAELLLHLRESGFTGAPRFLGVEDGRDVLDHLPGEVGHYPLTAAVRSETALITAARLLRGLHEATGGPIERWRGGWLFGDREPAEVVCHGDFAPYNVVFDGERAVGVIDFDTAHPAPRAWDVAYALYRFAPLTADGPAPAEQARRASAFCAAYGELDRAGLVDLVAERLRVLIAYMRERAAAGDAVFATHLARGDDLIYERDIAHVGRHAATLRDVLERR